MWILIRKILATEIFWVILAPILLTKGKKKMEEVSEKHPWNLPRGTFRATLTMLLTLAVLLSFYWPDFECPNWFVDVWLVAIGYYVGYRTDNSQVKEKI